MTQDSAKKIIVDEDWKTQVERERDAARKSADAEPAQTADTSSDAELPPASLAYLANSLSIQASIYLGLVPDPVSGKQDMNLPVAKHMIDILEVLQQKTEGNRTPDETEYIEALLHQLRMAYVQLAG